MKCAAPPVLLLRDVRCGGIGKFRYPLEGEACMGVPTSQASVQFVYWGWDRQSKVVLIEVFVVVCYQCRIVCRVKYQYNCNWDL